MGGLSTKDNGRTTDQGAEKSALHPRATSDPASDQVIDTATILSTVAHDLRSPLTTIIGFSDVLLSGRMGKLNSGQKKQLRIVLNRSTEALALMDDLVDYSRILSHMSEVCVATLSLNSLLKNIIATLRTTVAEKGTELTFAIPETALRIQGEERKLAQLFRSIVLDGTAFFRPRQIRVTVEDHGSEAGPSTENSARATIAFFDTPELDPEEFYNWNAESEIPGSFRLHVYLARFYLRAMGGELTITSQGNSTQFIIILCKVPL